MSPQVLPILIGAPLGLGLLMLVWGAALKKHLIWPVGFALVLTGLAVYAVSTNVVEVHL